MKYRLVFEFDISDIDVKGLHFAINQDKIMNYLERMAEAKNVKWALESRANERVFDEYGNFVEYRQGWHLIADGAWIPPKGE
jgi:hypothetical protein